MRSHPSELTAHFRENRKKTTQKSQKMQDGERAQRHEPSESEPGGLQTQPCCASIPHSMSALRQITEHLKAQLSGLSFSAPVSAVYNPLEYASAAHTAYLDRYGQGTREVLLVGMNPGPWGMAQTGVPFGAVPLVRDWLDIEAPVAKPAHEHVKKPVDGFRCTRIEVSGKRLWEWAANRFGTPTRFFQRFFVINYCPLLFLDAAGRNLTPDKLSADERQQLTDPCDAALATFVRHFRPQWVVGVGAFAETRARFVLAGEPIRVGRILHPSPASPAANRGWAEAAERDFAALGIVL